jgi:hypothetical protein
MNQTIENTSPSLIKRMMNETFIIWCFVFAGAILSNGLLFGLMHHENGFFITLYPWVNAGGHTINNGLEMFAGKMSQLPNLAVKLGYLTSLSIVFVIFPTLFFFGLRKRAIERTSGNLFPIIRSSTIQFVLGGMVTLGVAMPSIPIAIIQINVSKSLHHAQEIQANKDGMINDINEIAWRFYEYRVLPKDFNGGAGSFIGCTLPVEYTSTQNGIYEFDVQDLQVTIKGISKKFSNSSISVKLSQDCKLTGWIYSGEFE